MTGKTSILSACILATTMWISSAAGCIPRHPAFSAPHLPRGLRPIAEPGHGNVAGSQRRALAAMLPPPGRRRAAHLGLRGSYGTYLTTLEKETKERQRGLRSLYEAEAAYDEGTIKVDKDHEIYYRVYGANKTSTKATALFLHGGPGAVASQPLSQTPPPVCSVHTGSASDQMPPPIPCRTSLVPPLCALLLALPSPLLCPIVSHSSPLHSLPSSPLRLGLLRAGLLPQPRPLLRPRALPRRPRGPEGVRQVHPPRHDSRK